MPDVSTDPWDAAVAELPEPAQAVARAVVRANAAVGAPFPERGPGALMAADAELRSTRANSSAMGGLAQFVHGLTSSLDDVVALAGEPEELSLLLALHQYLMLAMGTGELRNQELSRELVHWAEEVAEIAPRHRPLVATALLLKAEHYAEGGRLAEATESIDRAIGELDVLSQHGERRHRAAILAARDAARAARAAVGRASEDLPMSQQRRDELDQIAYDHERLAQELMTQGRYSDALPVFGLAVRISEELAAAFPRSLYTVRSLGVGLHNCAMCLGQADEPVPAIDVGSRAREIYLRLVWPDAPHLYSERLAELETLLAEQFAAATASGIEEVAGRRATDEVVRAGTAAADIYRGLHTQTGRHLAKLAGARAAHAAALQRIGRNGDAQAVAEEALDDFRRADDDDLDLKARNQFAAVAMLVATTQHDVGNHVAARAAAADALEQWRRLADAGIDCREHRARAEFFLGMITRALHPLVNDGAAQDGEEGTQHLVDAYNRFSELGTSPGGDIDHMKDVIVDALGYAPEPPRG